MAIDFPNTPTNGQLFTVGEKTWQYVSAESKWISAGGTIGPTGPTGPTGATGATGPIGPTGAGVTADSDQSILPSQIFS